MTSLTGSTAALDYQALQVKLDRRLYPGGKIFDKAAFTPPSGGQQGGFARNVPRGFGATQVDLALQRQFHLTGKVGLSFRGEFFNIFNHPNFGPPNNSLTSPLFGHSTQTLAEQPRLRRCQRRLQPPVPHWRPRSIQLALKL
jgi:hypothetical protein